MSIFRKDLCKSSGFTLVEALVALLVLSIGLVGYAAMQLKAMQSAHVAYQRSVATMAAQDLAERLWIGLGQSAPASILCPAVTSGMFNDWLDEWEVNMPSLSREDSEVVKEGCKYTITVKWGDERFQDEEPSELTYVVSLLGEAL